MEASDLTQPVRVSERVSTSQVENDEAFCKQSTHGKIEPPPAMTLTAAITKEAAEEELSALAARDKYAQGEEQRGWARGLCETRLARHLDLAS